MTTFRKFLTWLDNIFTQGKQHWLTSKIPKKFVDIDYLIEVTLFQCLIRYWEVDDGKHKYASRLTDEEFEGEERAIWETLNEVYRWAKTDRHVAKLNLDALRSVALACVEEGVDGNTEEAFEAVRAAELNFQKKDDFALEFIVTHRRALWS